MKPDYDTLPKRPTEFFEFLIEQRWSYFVSLDTEELNNNQMSIVALVKACRSKNLKAIKAGMNRIDGKLAVVVEVEQPRFYMEYPNAPTTGLLEAPKVDTFKKKAEDEHIPTTGLRNTLRVLGNAKTGAVNHLLDLAGQVERLAMDGITPADKQNPFVKSIIMASLLSMGHSGDLTAIFEILDTIDGVVADKVKLLGDDVVLQNHSLVAPPGAYLGPNGVPTMDMASQANAWGQAIASKRGIDLAIQENNSERS
jgi:hypothetical protein